MNKSLRDEVAELRDANQGSWLGEHLRQMLDRHPPADGVSVPRDLLLRLGVKIAKSLPKTHPMTYDDDLSALLKLLYVTAADLAPADAILSEGKA